LEALTAQLEALAQAKPVLMIFEACIGLTQRAWKRLGARWIG
jgi:hypothetical protein